MSESGQSRHFDRGPAPSGLPRSTDIVRPPRHVGLVPRRDMGGDLHLVSARLTGGIVGPDSSAELLISARVRVFVNMPTAPGVTAMVAPNIQLSRLRDIGWELWDPIGLQVVRDQCDDEYDRYLLEVVARLERGDATQSIANYLVTMAGENMGLGQSPSALTRASATVAAIKVYLETLGREQ